MRFLLLFHQWHFQYDISETFFAFSLRHLESQIDTYVKSHHVYKDIWTPEIGESLDAQIEPNKPVDKYAVSVRKVVGHLKKGATSRFAKTVFFPGRWSLFEGKNNNIWAQTQSWWWCRFEGSLQTKAFWSSEIYRLIARWTYETERILNLEIMMQNNFFSLQKVKFSTLSSLYWDIFGSRERKYGS